MQAFIVVSKDICAICPVLFIPKHVQMRRIIETRKRSIGVSNKTETHLVFK